MSSGAIIRTVRIEYRRFTACAATYASLHPPSVSTQFSRSKSHIYIHGLSIRTERGLSQALFVLQDAEMQGTQRVVLPPLSTLFPRAQMPGSEALFPLCTINPSGLEPVTRDMLRRAALITHGMECAEQETATGTQARLDLVTYVLAQLYPKVGLNHVGWADIIAEFNHIIQHELESLRQRTARPTEPTKPSSSPTHHPNILVGPSNWSEMVIAV